MKTYVTVVTFATESLQCVTECTEPPNLQLHSHEISLTPISIAYADINTKTVA